jgi:sugar phosphate permease
VVLAVGMLAMTAGCAFQFGLPFLIPALRAEGLSLSQAGILVACPSGGLLLALVAWGAAADRWGERLVLSSGLGLAGLVLLASMTVRSPIALGACFLLAGAAGASVHASSGRLILSRFAGHERGLAMGIRQTAQPLGVAVAALMLPPLSTVGHAAPLMFLGAASLAAAVLVVVAVRDPARPQEQVNTHIGSPTARPCCGAFTRLARC